MDGIDRRILELLRSDARMSHAALGRQVGLSRTATLARVARLERAGVLRGYHAEVVLPADEAAHVARVAVTARTSDPRGYVRRILALDEVTQVESVAGESDLLVRIEASSASQLDTVLDEIAGWPETERTTTFVVLREHRA